MKEREQKCLLTKRQHRKLCEFVKVFYKYNIACDTQTNYYYDTLDLFFDRNQTTVRIREKDGNRVGTIKIHAVTEYDCSEEILFDVDEIPAKLDYQEKELFLHGALITHRISVPVHPDIMLCLDENHYLGMVDYELEIEYKEGYHAETWRWLMFISMILHKGRYQAARRLRYASNKSARFFARLKKKERKNDWR